MRKIIFFTILFFGYLATHGSVNATTDSFDPNSVIISYKEGESPEDLRLRIKERLEASSNFLIYLKKTREDLFSRLRGKPLPEEKLRILEQKIHLSKVKGSQIIEIKKRSAKVGKKIHVLKLQHKADIEEVINALQSYEGVEYIEPNFIVRGQSQASVSSQATNDPNFSNQWALTNIDAESSWALESVSKVTVAVIDTGILYEHEDIPKNSDIIVGPNFIDESGTSVDDNGHGTHIAGIIGALRNNSLGISGVSGNVRLMGIKSLNSAQNGTVSAVIAGIEYAVANGAKVINLSLGAEGQCPASLQSSITNAYNSGVTVVVAAGNSNIDVNNPQQGTYFFPSNCQNVIAVGATNSLDEKATYSNYGDNVDVWAPGGQAESGNCVTQNSIPCIISTYIQGSPSSTSVYAALSGTSMAAPHVSGVVSMLIAKNSLLTPAQIEQILIATGENITISQLQSKRLNSYNAINAVSLSLTPTATPTATPIPSPTNTPTPTPTNTPTPTPTPIKKIITWTTNNPSSSQVSYGMTTSLGFQTSEANTVSRVTNHSVELNNLIKCTTYYYKTVSRAVDNTVTEGGISTFVSDGCTGSSAILSSETVLIQTSTGGQLSVDQSSTRGITLDFPPNFITSGSIFTQIQRLERDKVAQAKPAPSTYLIIDPYVYELHALSSPTSSVSSFSQGINVTIRYQVSEMQNFNLDTLVIARHNGSSWQTLPDCQRLSSPTRVTCKTQQFSTFALVGQAALTNTPRPQNTNTPTPTSSISPTPKCDIYPDPKAPDIFQIDVLENQATIHLSPAGTPVSYYFVSYGFDQNAEGFGGEFSQGDSSGAVKFDLKSLAKGTAYYVKARGGNACKTGEWSSVKKFTTESGDVAGVVTSAKKTFTAQEIAVNPDSTNNQAPIVNRSDGSIAVQGQDGGGSQISNPTKNPAELPKAGTSIFQMGIFAIGVIIMGVLL
jgi:subtilisin family serine protease